MKPTTQLQAIAVAYQAYAVNLSRAIESGDFEQIAEVLMDASRDSRRGMELIMQMIDAARGNRARL